VWHQDEITILKTIAVDEKRPLIPVLLDADVKVPTILDMAMVSRELAADGVAVGLRLAMVEVLVATHAAKGRHGGHPEVIGIGTEDADGLLEGLNLAKGDFAAK